MSTLPAYLFESSKLSSCPNIDQLIDYYLFGQDSEEHQEIKEHLSNCKLCLEELRIIKEFDQHLY